MQVALDDLKLIADKLSPDLEFYRNKNIFITGGTGFFGKWLLEAFIYLNKNNNLNVSLTILSRSPGRFKENFPHLFNHYNYKFVEGDVRNFPDIAGNFDLIIHAATDASSELNKSNPELMRSTIMDGTRRICKFAKKVNCKRILYISSGAAYGQQPENLIHMPETFVDNPLFNYNDAYASTKLESDNYFTENAPCEIVIARCFAFAGPYLPLDGSYAFGNFIADALQQRAIFIKGDGTAIRSYLYAADLVIWLLRILSSGKSKNIYNVGSHRSVSISELAYIINTISINKSEIHVLAKETKNINRYIPDINKAKFELNLNVYTSLEAAVKRTLEFNLKNAVKG